MNCHKFVARLAVTAVSVACMSVTPVRSAHSADAPELSERSKELLKKLNALNNQGREVENKAPAQSTVTPSEEEMNKRLEGMSALSGTVSIVQKNDGFTVNGRPFIDQEGTIVKYGYDGTTGDVTYLAQTGSQQYAVKYVRANSDKEPITIATALETGDGWTINTATGKTLRGETVIPLAKGLLVNRSSAGFIYQPGKGSKQIALPDGYVMSQFQNGEIQSTRYMLIEKSKEDNGGLFSKFKSLGSTLGVNDKNDFAFLNIDSGEMIPINITIDAKDVSLRGECRKKSRSSIMAQCQYLGTTESLYQQNGLPNGGHYYWQTNWINTPSGPILIWTDGGFGAKTMLYNPISKKKVIAFSRTLGINFITVENKGNGKYSLTGQLGFGSDTIDDIEAFFIKTAAVAEKGA